MNPIPLTTPAGVVLAYACGRCKIVHGAGTFARDGSDEAVERCREESLFQAEHCGGCKICHEAWTASCDEIMCAPCNERHERLRWWRRWCWAWEEVMRVAMQGLTYEQWKALQPTEPDDDE